MRSSGWIVIATVAATVAVVACQQIVGTNKTRRPAPVDAAIVTETDAAPKPNEEMECGAGQKKCDGVCVAIDDPTFGCTPTSCDQCSLPFAATTKCKEGACSVATCTSGHADCNDRGDDGCEADLLDAKTCGNCTTACGAAASFCTPFGTCVADCGDLTPCGTTCVDLNNGSAKHCGQCNRNCPTDPGNHGDAACVNAQCTIKCHSGFADCNPATPGCEPLQRFYLDGDNDGFGAGPFELACTAPAGRVPVAGDCNDANNQVRPNQTAYFTAPYTVAGGQPSFDYNCSGSEEGHPGQAVSTACTPCSPGYAAAAVPRQPNPRCGSTIFNLCPENSSVCSGVSVASAYACR